MKTTRRGFLGALTVAPVVAALAPKALDWIPDDAPFGLLRPVYPVKGMMLDRPETFVGSFELSEVFPPVRTTNGLMLLSEEAHRRLEETTRNLGAWIDQEYMKRS